VRFEIAAYQYQLSANNFIQANLFQLAPMLTMLEKTLSDKKIAKAVDLFCGSGFLTLPLARFCGEVLAVENDPENIVALKNNLTLNRMTNVGVMQANVLRSELPPADLYVTDPSPATYVCF
jgi:tRNA/tmRNA/rRNA uracil-C5-methylase (TrmA/RlmC/RlmD family)